MKAVQISRTGGPDVLEYVDLPTPDPGDGEVLIETEAAGVQLFDLLIRTGRYRWMPDLPFVPGNELVGRVAALGPGAGRLKVGQRVLVVGYDIGNRGGLYADHAAVPEAAVWPLPDAVDPVAATTLTNYQLAWILMFHAARGVEPRTVVVHGAAGGVGTALTDVARLHGAEVIGLAGSAAKCDFVRTRGAHAIDHSRESAVELVEELTGGHGADLILDNVAGPGFTDNLKMIAPLGMVVSYGLLGGMPEDDLFAAMRANLDASPAVRCFTMHTYDHLPEPRREAMERAVGLLADGRVEPAIAARIPLAEAAEAHRLIESRTAMGKVVLTP
jgi:NADPH2:quinone reductase